jgi:hypothetical protein
VDFSEIFPKIDDIFERMGNFTEELFGDFSFPNNLKSSFTRQSFTYNPDGTIKTATFEIG